MVNLKDLTIRKAHESLKKGDFSVKELVDEYLKIIEEKNDDINAFLEIYEDLDDQIEKAQKMIENGEADLLTGIPIAVKDNILIKGKKVSAASKILEGYTATYDATVIGNLKEKGVVFLGRTNMDEFAMGGSTENSAFGITKNPLDQERVPGGSSGGSAAAVAMHGALVSLGSDTGGSIRQPAAFCGRVGLKPTYGSVSRNGLIAYGSSFDQIGPISNSLEDAEIMFNALRSYDEMDSTSVSDQIYDSWKKKPKGIVGLPKEIFEEEGIDPVIRDNIEKAVKDLESKGVKIKEVSLPSLKYSLATYYIIAFAESSTNLARFDGVKYGFHKDGKDLIDDYFETRGEGFGQEVKRRIMLGTYVLSSGYYDAYYNKATIVRDKIKKEFKDVFESVDSLITPTTPTPAFKIGEKSNNPLEMYLEDIFTVPVNITGVPAISVPFGEIEGLPLGVQLVGAWGNESTLFELGKKLVNES